MTPVTRTALIWCFSTPNIPTSADDPRMIRHTKAQEIDKFCIPATELVQNCIYTKVKGRLNYRHEVMRLARVLCASLITFVLLRLILTFILKKKKRG